MTAPINATVVVVDDEPIIRRSINRLLEAVGYTVKTYGTPTEFFEQPLPASPACVLLDMCMEGMTGLEVHDELRKGDRKIPVIFVTGHGTVPTAARSFRLGAEDFLEKPYQPQELIEAVKRAVEHDRRQAADRIDREELKQRYENLTPREREVMACVVSGLLNKQTATELGITEKTIKTHRARVMEKMRVESLAALVVVAERLGLEVASTAPARILDAELWPTPGISEDEDRPSVRERDRDHRLALI